MTSQKQVVGHPLSRREVLAGGLRLGGSVLAVIISARALGLAPAIVEFPEKIVIGQLPFSTEVTIYAEAIGQFPCQGKRCPCNGRLTTLKQASTRAAPPDLAMNLSQSADCSCNAERRGASKAEMGAAERGMLCDNCGWQVCHRY